MKNMKTKIISLLTAVAMMSCCFSEIGAKATDTSSNSAGSKGNTTTISSSTYGTGPTSYKAYMAKYAQYQLQPYNVPIDITKYTTTENCASLINETGKSGKCVETAESGSVTWQVNVDHEGLYNINVEYFPEIKKGKGSAIVRNLKIDGKSPYDEASNLSFCRTFKNANKIITDVNGNQIRPSQVEAPQWLEKDLSDTLGYYNNPFEIYFSKGSHTVTFESVREPMVIGSIKLYESQKSISYQQALSDYQSNGYNDVSANVKPIKIQGEDAELKSTSMIYPLTDNTTPATEPSSVDKILLNTIGGIKWETCGQWVQWSFNVETSGLYEIGFKVRQNTTPGQPSYRKVMIDGKVPYQDMENVKFPYSSRWQVVVPGGEKNPDKVYLSAGKHTLKMYVTMGDIANLVQKTSNVINKLNNIYMDLLMIIGQTADTSRDYQLDTYVPQDLKQLGIESNELKKIYNEYVKICGMGGSQAQIISNLAQQTGKMYRDPDKIPQMFANFSNNISTLGTWLTTAQNQPLEIDYIQIIPPKTKFKKATNSFFSNFAFMTKQFFASFFIDYNAIGSTAKTNSSVRVWIGSGGASGRDQANALNQMIINDFTPKNKIHVNLQLVSAGVLLTATLAHKGPDVALTLAQSDPMNYAIRGAVVDLSKFSDYNEVKKRYAQSAMLPLTFDGHVYGLPETQNFPMMFYRSDILNALHLSVPQTWDDVIAMLPVLQKKNLNFGLPLPMSTAGNGVGLPVYAMFLYQNGGSFYNGNGSSSKLSENAAIDAFYKWTSFYTDYSLPNQYDFNTRFRSGIIPIGIADYGTYNSLSVFAPELNGIWKFALVPGTRKADGSIDRTVASTISATVMMKDAKNKSDAWKFMKWWDSAPIQENYGRELESIMGTAARYQTANIEALYQIPWSTSDFKLLVNQLQWTKGIPEVPGSYMTPRYVDFAFKQVAVSKAENPAKVLVDETKEINNELTSKRIEFGLQ